MYIEKQVVQGREYLRLVEYVKKIDAAGRTRTGRHVVLNLGKLSELEDGQPNYLERLRESFRSGNPIIPELQRYVELPSEGSIRCWNVKFLEGSEDCTLARYKFGGELLEVLFRELGLAQLFSEIKSHSRTQYDIAGIARLLIFGRVLEPKSKIATMADNTAYFNPPISNQEFNNKKVYAVLDDIYRHREQIFGVIDRNIRQKAGRDTSVIMYDVTNVYTEIDNPDEEEIVEGVSLGSSLRAYGKSKEGRKKPIVQMSLFADRNGIPLAIEVFRGNVPDVSTAQPSLKMPDKAIAAERFIFVADRGISSQSTCAALVQQGRGYVISKSIAKSSKAHKEWILSDKDWIHDGSSFRYKSKICTVKGETADGDVVSFRQKTVVYWSRKYYEKELKDHNRMVELLERLQNEDGFVPVDRLERGYVAKNFKKFVVVSEENGIQSGEVIPKKDLMQLVDLDKLKQDVALLGYYQVVTSEIDTPDRDVIDLYKNLVRIETEFHTLKGPLDLRPLYVRLDEHIEGHFVICFIALTMLRLIQKRITEAGSVTSEQAEEDSMTGCDNDPTDESADAQKVKENSDSMDRQGTGVQETSKKDPHESDLDEKLMWTYGLSGDRIRKALNDWQIVRLPNAMYAFSYMASANETNAGCMSADLQTILHAFGIQLPLKLYSRAELSKLKGSIRCLER